MKLPSGFLASGVRVGLKTKGPDLALIVAPNGADAAAVFTRNAFCAAPVVLSRAALKKSKGRIRAVVVNAGCANAVTGAPGDRAAKSVQAHAAKLAGCAAREVFVASTGVIGKLLPDARINEALPGAWARLSVGGLESASAAILTTDAGPKIAEARYTIAGEKARLVGFAKGAGMIHPNMATMLGFLMTDAAIAPPILKKCLKHAADESWNIISVDGDTSTNDCVLLMASGVLGNRRVVREADAADFGRALTELCQKLAWMIVRDGEGASRVMDIEVTGARNDVDARAAAHAIATSPLVKTAVNGGDPNWGRILAAVGRSGARVKPERTNLYVGTLALVKNGLPTAYDEARAGKLFSQERVRLRVDLGQGTGRARRWASDLGHAYVSCNADYRT